MIPPIANQFVAGESQRQALERANDLAERNVGTILNLLGEHYADPAKATRDTQAYLGLIEKISGSNERTCISVKPSQIGLDIGEVTFRDNLFEIVDTAARSETFVWIDMEDHTTTDITLDAFETLAARHGGNVGICVQANLRRTEEDLKRLATVPGKVRLVKGAYDEPDSVAYQSKEIVNQQYRSGLQFMFEEFDGGIAVGSHDPEMIELATELYEEHRTDFEIQMLMGVREDAQTELATKYDVWQYAPFGDKWFSYFYRRVMERKENALFALRAILGR